MPTGERALAARPLVGGERQRGNIRGDGRGRDLDSMTASVRREEGCRLNGRPTADKFGGSPQNSPKCSEYYQDEKTMRELAVLVGVLDSADVLLYAMLGGADRNAVPY